MTRYNLSDYLQVITNAALGTIPWRFLAVFSCNFFPCCGIKWPITKLPSLKVYPTYTCRKPHETNLHKWYRFPRERLLTNIVSARSPLEARIKTQPLDIQQIIVTKVWQNRTVDTSVEEIWDFSDFIEKNLHVDPIPRARLVSTSRSHNLLRVLTRH